MKVYNKLVRDKIPQIIEADNKIAHIRIADQSDRGKLLEDKLIEEFNEYLEDKNLEELADMMEVVIGLAQNLGYTEEDLLKKMYEKRETRGGFKEGIFLERVEDKQ